MNREQFVRQHEASWRQVESILARLDTGGKIEHELGRLPELYRRCCNHLALARGRGYDAALEDRLNRIALRGYHHLYRHQRRVPWSNLLAFIATGFPRLVRRNAGLFWLATALLYVPGLIMAWLVLSDPDAIFTILDHEAVANFEQMYDTAPDEERSVSSDFNMFGFYIWNNISVAFRTFAAGIFAGVGTAFMLIFNGLLVGALFAHLSSLGAAGNLLTFVITHGAFELTAIVLAGLAGLRLGAAVLAPGRLRRSQALRQVGPECAQLLVGIVVLLLIAAFVEAFWSSAAWMPANGKLLIGGFCWLAVASWLSFAGRSRES